MADASRDGRPDQEAVVRIQRQRAARARHRAKRRLADQRTASRRRVRWANVMLEGQRARRHKQTLVAARARKASVAAARKRARRAQWRAKRGAWQASARARERQTA